MTPSSAPPLRSSQPSARVAVGGCGRQEQAGFALVGEQFLERRAALGKRLRPSSRLAAEREAVEEP